MKPLLKHFFTVSLLLLIFSCSNNDSANKDEEKPVITINYDGGFPQACVELAKGKTYQFRALVSDNQALASYSIDIHHNFDHHTHDDQGKKCDLSPVKSAVKPFIFMKNYAIENGLTKHEINASITIPNDIDTGDYHCQYSVTDQTGWQSRTSIDIKIIE